MMNTMKDFDFDKFTDSSSSWYEIASNTSEVSASPDWKHLGKNCENKIVSFSKSPHETIFSSGCYINKKKVGEIHGRIFTKDPLVASRMEIDFGKLSRNSKYWVYDTDYTSFAVVGNDSGKYWILSRESQMCPDQHFSLLTKLKEHGFDSSKERINLDVLKNCSSKAK